MKLAASIEDVFGKISPPPGAGAINSVDPASGLGNLITALLRLTFFGAGIAALIYMLWGAANYVVSGGDKEKIEKARDRISQAAVGMIILVAVLTIYSVITGNILGIVDISQGGLIFKLPTFEIPAVTAPPAPPLPGPHDTPAPI